MSVDSALIGVFLGFALGEGARILAQRKKNKTSFSAIKAEVNFCCELAQTYLDDLIMSPLYRLPTKAYESSLPQLLSASAINQNELQAIQKYYMEVESLNRGLDQAELARNDLVRLQNEFERNKGKATFLIDSKRNKANYYIPVTLLINKRC